MSTCLLHDLDDHINFLLISFKIKSPCSGSLIPHSTAVPSRVRLAWAAGRCHVPCILCRAPPLGILEQTTNTEVNIRIFSYWSRIILICLKIVRIRRSGCSFRNPPPGGVCVCHVSAWARVLSGHRPGPKPGLPVPVLSRLHPWPWSPPCALASLASRVRDTALHWSHSTGRTSHLGHSKSKKFEIVRQ